MTTRYFHESRTVRCVACRMVLTGTVAEVADRYRNHQCVERWYPIVDLPSLYTAAVPDAAMPRCVVCDHLEHGSAVCGTRVPLGWSDAFDARVPDTCQCEGEPACRGEEVNEPREFLPVDAVSRCGECGGELEPFMLEDRPHIFWRCVECATAHGVRADEWDEITHADDWTDDEADS